MSRGAKKKATNESQQPKLSIVNYQLIVTGFSAAHIK